MSKCETQVEKKSLVGDGFEFGKYRFQVYGDDKIHVHDDDKSLVFEFVNKRRFQLGIEDFIKHNSSYPIGAKVVMRGATGKGKEGPAFVDRAMADLVLIRSDRGWDLVLEPVGTSTDVEVIGDGTVAFLSNFIDSF